MKDPTPPEDIPAVTLDAKAIAAIAKAPITAGGGGADADAGPSDASVKADILKSIAGDQAGLQKEWDSFYEKSTKPGEGDDDDDEEEEEGKGFGEGCLFLEGRGIFARRICWRPPCMYPRFQPRETRANEVFLDFICMYTEEEEEEEEEEEGKLTWSYRFGVFFSPFPVCHNNVVLTQWFLQFISHPLQKKRKKSKHRCRLSPWVTKMMNMNFF